MRDREGKIIGLKRIIDSVIKKILTVDFVERYPANDDSPLERN